MFQIPIFHHVCPLPLRFLGLSLALRSHDQFEASYWLTLPECIEPGIFFSSPSRAKLRITTLFKPELSPAQKFCFFLRPKLSSAEKFTFFQAQAKSSLENTIFFEPEPSPDQKLRFFQAQDQPSSENTLFVEPELSPARKLKCFRDKPKF